MRIVRVTVGIMCTNTYIVFDQDTLEGVLIDPGDKEEMIVNKIEEYKVKPQAILLTHGHFDHIGAADGLRKRYGIEIYVMEAEKELMASEDNLASLIRRQISLSADKYLQDNDVITIAGITFKVLHTPGHTIGSCCYYVENEGVLFSGDTLFCNSHGRTDFPTGSQSSIMRSITERLIVLPEDTMVYPGHNDETTIGYERHNYDIYQI